MRYLSHPTGTRHRTAEAAMRAAVKGGGKPTDISREFRDGGQWVSELAHHFLRDDTPDEMMEDEMDDEADEGDTP